MFRTNTICNHFINQCIQEELVCWVYLPAVNHCSAQSSRQQRETFSYPFIQILFVYVSPARGRECCFCLNVEIRIRKQKFQIRIICWKKSKSAKEERENHYRHNNSLRIRFTYSLFFFFLGLFLHKVNKIVFVWVCAKRRAKRMKIIFGGHTGGASQHKFMNSCKLINAHSECSSQLSFLCFSLCAMCTVIVVITAVLYVFLLPHWLISVFNQTSKKNKKLFLIICSKSRKYAN